MRFLLYNVRYCAGTGRGFHFPFPFGGYLRPTSQNLDRIIDFIWSHHPDIVGLVEVDSGSYRSAKLNQAEIIARALGHYHSFNSKYGETSVARKLPLFNKQVNAFLTSDKIQTERFHYFDSGVKRLVIELELENLSIFLVHLSLKFRHRQYQLRDLHSLVKAVKKPCIVAGDFNVLWGDRELQLFLAATGLLNANVEGLRTFPSWNPTRQLDFILCSPGIKVTGFQAPQVTLSDHLPLVCDFEMPGS
ncbi:MAG TPA: endonuclease [Verrucomicrobia bacterium]|nr:MAG: endonuclease [Lentisphaerae bacterium GWF2_57_35]HBA84097.1 endonuclease [Verrucomicrobiota bacterium]